MERSTPGAGPVAGVPNAASAEPFIFISAALIVRDEEHHLPACLESVSAVADEVVVVDTGSVDRSVAIAEAAGARVFHQPWQDDFALARNAGIDRCRGRWILYIDADERMRSCSRQQLLTTLDDPGLMGATVTLHPVTGHSGYRELRLFRNDPAIRFEGAIHETIWPAVLNAIDGDRSRVGESNVVLDHVGYDGRQDHKHDRNLPLLLKALDQDPDHIYCWSHLGRTYMGLYRPADARAAWTSGIEAIHRTEHLRPADSLPFIDLISDALGRGDDADDLIAEGRELFPDDDMLAWLDARALMIQTRYDEAIEMFTALIAAEEAGRLSPDFGYAPHQFTSLTHAMVGACHQSSGRHAAAAHHFARAEDYEPDNLEYRAKRTLNQHLAAR
jgi:hypothetical protein